MKVIYVNVTIPSYTHPLLERIVSKGCDLIMLLPQNDDKTVGTGVKRAEAKKRPIEFVIVAQRSNGTVNLP